MKGLSIKRLLSVLALAILMTATAFSLFACGSSNVDAIKVDATDFAVEANQTFLIPQAYTVDKAGERLEEEPAITVTNPNGIVVATSSIEIKAKVLGDYVITYTHPDADDVVITAKCQDTQGPTLELDDVFYNAYKGEKVKLPNVEISDFSEINTKNAVFKVFRVDGDDKEEMDIEQLSNTFIPDKTGNYVYQAEISDVVGNTTKCEWGLYVTDKTWLADDASGATVATFDNADYKNVFGGGTATDRQGNADVTILDEYQGETGVAEVKMNYFDHNFGNYSSVNVRFPREYKYEEGKRLAIKIFAEELNIHNSKLNVMQYEHTHVYGVGVNIVSSYLLKEGVWTTVVLENNVLKALSDENGVIKGIQLDVCQSADFADTTAQTVYIASITEINTLAAPTAFSESGEKVLWEEVPSAVGYIVVDDNGREYVVDAAEFAKPDGAYRIRVKAMGDGAYYENSVFSKWYGNILESPENLTLSSSGLLKWNRVDGATGYVVIVNGQEVYNGTGTSYVFNQPKDKNYVIKVKAKGNGSTTYDSDLVGIPVRYVANPEGVVANFDDETSLFDVRNVTISNLYGMAAQSFKTEYLPEYKGETGVLKISVTVGVNGWGVVSLKLPQTLIIDDTLRSMTLTFRLEGVERGDYKGLRVYGHGTGSQGTGIIPEIGNNGIDAWYTVTMTRDLIVSGYRGATSSDYMVFGVALMPPESTYYLYLDEITEERWEKLETPDNLKVQDGSLTWDAVEGAEGYIVTINGETERVTGTSFDLTSYPVYTVTVQAVSEKALWSSQSQTVTNVIEAPEGLSYDNGVIRWNEVENAASYKVNINGTEYDTAVNSYNFAVENDKNYVIKVLAVAKTGYGNSAYNKGIAIRNKGVSLDYIADFSDKTFEYDIMNVNGVNLINASYTANELTAEYLSEYEGKTDVLKVGIKYNALGRGTASLKLANAILVDKYLQSITLTFRLEGADTGTGLRVLAYRDSGTLRGNSLDLIPQQRANGVGEWATITLTAEEIKTSLNDSATCSYLDMAVENAKTSSVDTFVYLYLDEIKVNRAALPQGTALEDFSSSSSDGTVKSMTSLNLANELGWGSKSITKTHLDSYMGKDGVVKIDFTINDNNVKSGGFKLEFAQSVNISDSLEYIAITLRIEGTNIGDGLRIYGFGADNQSRGLGMTDVKGQWITVVYDAETAIAAFNGTGNRNALEFAVANSFAGNSVTVYFDSITYAYKTA